MKKLLIILFLSICMISCGNQDKKITGDLIISNDTKSEKLKNENETIQFGSDEIIKGNLK